MSVLQRLQNARANNHKLLAWLVDPDCHPSAELAQSMKGLIHKGLAFIFVGGSFVHHFPTQTWMGDLRAQTGLPLVLFPGSPLQLVEGADALLFLSLISGRNPELLIGHHVLAAPRIQQLDIEVVPCGYMLVDGGAATSVSYVSNTQPLPYDKPDLARFTALAGQYLGLQLLYLDAGSGASKTPATETIVAIRHTTDLPLVVGGGVRSAADAHRLHAAGADLVVIGNAFESDTANELLAEF